MKQSNWSAQEDRFAVKSMDRRVGEQGLAVIRYVGLQVRLHKREQVAVRKRRNTMLRMTDAKGLLGRNSYERVRKR
eukprot:6182873-Pleurochrysis_carterae.AAC.2